MKLFSKNEINIGRQFEFDLAKAICIFGMVFVHCFEQFPLKVSDYSGSLYYVLITVLNALFGAGTFMICLGIGLTYTKNNKPIDFIKRGIVIFLMGYLLNLLRFVIPYSYYFGVYDFQTASIILTGYLLYTDIFQFAGLSFIVFGLLKKIKTPDWLLAIIAISLSVVGSLFRFINIDSIFLSEFLGLFIGTTSPNSVYPYYAPFAFLNWFIFVIFGYFFGKLIRRVENIEKFYMISTIASGIIVATYMAIAIPNKIGMMCGNETYYFHTTTWEALIIMCSAIFVFGLYHYISKLFNVKIKKAVTELSMNMNIIYYLHWILIGIIGAILWNLFEDEGLDSYIVIIIALFIFILSVLLSLLIKRKKLAANKPNEGIVKE